MVGGRGRHSRGRRGRNMRTCAGRGTEKRGNEKGKGRGRKRKKEKTVLFSSRYEHALFLKNDSKNEFERIYSYGCQMEIYNEC